MKKKYHEQKKVTEKTYQISYIFNFIIIISICVKKKLHAPKLDQRNMML